MEKPTPNANGADPGELMNVREVHGAIMREWKLPGEGRRRVPWYLRILYIALAIWAYAYLATYSGDFNWAEYEHRASARFKRERLEHQAEVKREKEGAATKPISGATESKP
jgi:hypothetical protein